MKRSRINAIKSSSPWEAVDREGKPLFSSPTPEIQTYLDVKFTFGKYRGRSLQHVLEIAPQYLKWCTDNLELRECPFTSAFYAVTEFYDEYINRVAGAIGRGL